MNGKLPEGYIGFCSYCILNLNGAITSMIGDGNTGRAKQMEGEVITFPNGYRIEWKPGTHLPAGGWWITDIFLYFGPEVDIRVWKYGSYRKLWPYAVTMHNGTLVCEDCNGRLFSGNLLQPNKPRREYW